MHIYLKNFVSSDFVLRVEHPVCTCTVHARTTTGFQILTRQSIEQKDTVFKDLSNS